MPKIANSLGRSQTTAIQVLNAVEEKGISHLPLGNLSDKDLSDLPFPESRKKAEYAVPDCARIHKELQKAVSREPVWLEYCDECHARSALPYQLTQFKKYYRDVEITATMHLNHKPGDIMQVDWAGDTTPVINMNTGETISAFVFEEALSFPHLI